MVVSTVTASFNIIMGQMT